MPSTRSRRWPWPKGLLATATVMATATILPVLGAVFGSGPAGSLPDSSAQIPRSVAAPTVATISPICMAPDASANLGPMPRFPSRPIRTVVSPRGGVVNFLATSSRIYVDTGTRLDTFTLSGSTIGSFALPPGLTGGNEISQPVVDPSGNIYLASYYGRSVKKFSPGGTLRWSVDPRGGNPTGLFAIGSGSKFEVAVSVTQNTSTSNLLDLSTGTVTGSFPLVDNLGYVTQEPDGNLLSSGDGYVTTVSSTGRVLSRFGSSRTEGSGVHTGSGAQFFYPAQAVQGADGTIYTADPPHTVEATKANGDLEASTTMGDALDMGGYDFFLEGSTFYFQGGQPFDDSGDTISSIPLATLQAYFTGAHVPLDTLGWGAGLSSTAAGNYSALGSTPTISATFDPWWTRQAAHLFLSYAVENETSLTAETVPASTRLSLPTDAAGLRHIPLIIPAVDRQPGPYLVQATLVDSSTSPPTRLGTTCLPYTVGAAGDPLNLSSLPAGIGSGGPTDVRGVALNAQLGLNGYRSGQVVDWGSVLPHCSATAPSPSTCGPTAMTFATISTDSFKAAALAQADHVSFWMQISGGDPVSMALVNSGLWQSDIAKLVSYYASPPAGCVQCAPVTTWEPWNEPNNTGWSNAGQYVAKVLKPFDMAVKSVEPGSSSTVIGGSSLNIPIDWWQQLIAAGGLADLDVAAVHPYPGNNDSFEEWGEIAQIQKLESLLGSRPLWFTEVGWWSDGDYNYLHQADAVARAMIWQKVLDVPVWNYYIDEGSFGDGGVSFSLIQAGSTDDYVKPAALATMMTAQQIGDRPYVSMPTTGIPLTYEAMFGPEAGGSTRLAAIWSDGLAVNGSVTVASPAGTAIPVTVTSEYGKVSTPSVTSGTAYRLSLSDQVTYVSYPAGDTLTLGPTQPYGPDLATAGRSVASATTGTASGATTGTVTGTGWSSTSGDSTPRLTVTLDRPSEVNRVIVDTQSVGSTAPSVRNYAVSVDRPGHGWTRVAHVVGQYRDHVMQLVFDPMVASAVRISVTTVNFGGYYGGGIPPFWSPGLIGNAFLHALQVYGGSESVGQVHGVSMPSLVTGTSPPR